MVYDQSHVGDGRCHPRKSGLAQCRDALLNEWEITVIGMSQVPEQHMMETLFRTQAQKHPGWKEHASYNERLPVGILEKNYDFLPTIVDVISRRSDVAKLAMNCLKGELGPCPRMKGAWREPMVIVTHGSIKASVLEATIVLS